MTPAISVLMPVYNAERYVAEAVRSILTQSFADFELLLVDDGSTDRSLRILRRFERRDRRIRLVSRENRGLVATLNEMIALARGEFLARMDADDVSLPGRFAAQVAYLREHPDVVCVGGGYRTVDPGGSYLCECSPTTEDSELQDELLSGLNPIIHVSAMMRRDAVAQVEGYRPEMQLAEDMDLWLRLGEVGRLANLPDVLIKYRVHGGSFSYANLERQLAVCRAAAEDAFVRRGIEPRPLRTAPYRPSGDLDSRYGFMLSYGWAAMLTGKRWHALRLGLRSIRMAPWMAGGWWLVRAALVPTRKGDST